MLTTKNLLYTALINVRLTQQVSISRLPSKVTLFNEFGVNDEISGKTICSKSCLEVRLTLDTEADRMHLKQQRQTGFDSHATAN